MRRAFTLIELLVVIAIIAILMALLVPAVQKVREAAARSTCANNMRQVAIAMHAHHSAKNGLPPGVSNATPYWGQGNWLVSILPYLEKGDLGSKYHDYGVPNGQTYDSAANIADVTGHSIPVMRCPSDTTNLNGWPGSASQNVSYHNYVVNFGNTGIDESANWQVATLNGLTFQGAPFTRGKMQKLNKITDGASNTLMVSEVIIGQGHDLRGLSYWGTGSGFSTNLRPNDSSPDLSWSDSTWCDPKPPNPPCAFRANAYVFGARSRHAGGVNVMYCDGSGRFISNDILPAVWQALSTTNGNETNTEP